MTVSTIQACRDLYYEIQAEGNNPQAYVYKSNIPNAPCNYSFAVFVGPSAVDLLGNPNIEDYIKLDLESALT